MVAIYLLFTNALTIIYKSYLLQQYIEMVIILTCRILIVHIYIYGEKTKDAQLPAVVLHVIITIIIYENLSNITTYCILYHNHHHHHESFVF
jgi:asparagine N-glycosylation enzyme membrane subunit Stt3